MDQVIYRAEIEKQWGKKVARITTETREGYDKAFRTVARLVITPDMTGADVSAWIRGNGFQAVRWARGSHTGIQRTMLKKI